LLRAVGLYTMFAESRTPEVDDLRKPRPE